VLEQAFLDTRKRTDTKRDTGYPGGLVVGRNGFDLRHQCVAYAELVHAYLISGKHLVVELPSRLRFLLRDFLDGITDVDNDEIINSQLLLLHHEKIDFTMNALGFTIGNKAINFGYLHGNSKAHNFSFRFFL
jgi:hypothetical protein